MGTLEEFCVTYGITGETLRRAIRIDRGRERPCSPKLINQIMLELYGEKK